MTSPDIAGLCERLRTVYKKTDKRFGEFEGDCVNPDGPEAADTLERQAAEIERLRGALGNLIRMNEEHNAAVEKVMGRPLNWSDNYLNEARAALTGEDTAGSPTSQNTEPGLPFSDAGEP
jgi:hypothetical protein